MVKKHTRASSGVGPAKTDDLRLVNGIGPAVESRLYGVGIYTFAQLAALSPADIAASVSGLAGLTAERISKQDWIGQAHKLAAQSALSEPDWIEHARQLSANGTVTRQKGAAGSPVENQPVTIATNEPQENLVVEAQRDVAALVDLEAIESNPSGTEEVEVEMISPLSEAILPAAELSAKGGPIRVLHLRELATIPAGANNSRNLLANGQSFDVYLTLDFTDVTVPEDATLNYTASIHARKLGDRTRQPIGETHGTITPSDMSTVKVEGLVLPQGTYRLQAYVTLTLPATESIPHPDLIGIKKGGLLQVY